MRENNNNFNFEKKNVVLLILAPILGIILFGCVYSKVYVEEIPIAIYDMDNSNISRSMIDNIQDSTGINVARIVDSQDEMEELLLNGEVSGGIIFPDDFGKNVVQKNSPNVLALVDGSNIVIGNNVVGYLSSVFNTVNAGIQINIMEGGGIIPYSAQKNITTLSFVDRILYNPQMGYFKNMFAVLLSILIQQLYLSAMATMLIEYKHKIREVLDTPKHIRTIIRNEIIPQILEGMASIVISFLVCLLVAHRFFGYQLKGSIRVTILVLLIFLVSLTAMALLFATFFENITSCVQVILLLSVPGVLSSGYIWPEFAMSPHFINIVKGTWPLYYFDNALRDLLLKGDSLMVIQHYITGGIKFGVFWFIVGAISYYIRIVSIKSDKQYALK
ncbi:transport permease protein [Clostridium gelidum]|uniref:Transport permease protein n=1 Tax=Clostridium gelidum TaxID=704125 RepID=A0ABM7T723_9CLOT|nr:ABC transporter permease [Clostridium gelidum]BCZ47173.1 transport permease protein [Clostridium gelidum]